MEKENCGERGKQPYYNGVGGSIQENTNDHNYSI